MRSIDPLDCPYYLVSRVSLMITSALKKRLAEAGLSNVKPAYLWALVSLWVSDGQKVSDTARSSGLETSTMTGLLDRMERDGLVTRNQDANDRRTLRIFLTEEGRRLREPLLDASWSVIDEFFEGIPKEDMEATVRTLAKILSKESEEAE